MATHSNILAWRIPWTEEPGDRSDLAHKREQTQMQGLSRKFFTERTLSGETHKGVKEVGREGAKARQKMCFHKKSRSDPMRSSEAEMACQSCPLFLQQSHCNPTLISHWTQAALGDRV